MLGYGIQSIKAFALGWVLNILEYNGIYYRIGEGHKEFIPDALQEASRFQTRYM